MSYDLAPRLGLAPAHPRMCTNGVPLRRFSREVVPELLPELVAELVPELLPRAWLWPGPCPVDVDVESGPEYEAGRDDLNGFGMNWVSVT